MWRKRNRGVEYKKKKNVREGGQRSWDKIEKIRVLFEMSSEDLMK